MKDSWGRRNGIEESVVDRWWAVAEPRECLGVPEKVRLRASSESQAGSVASLMDPPPGAYFVEAAKALTLVRTVRRNSVCEGERL